MSEKLSQSHERQQRYQESLNNKELANNNIEANKEVHNKHAESIGEIRKTIEKQAVEAESTKAEKEESQPTTQQLTKELKSVKYKETMRYVRRHLSPSERKLSSFMHTPVVEKVSEVSSKTIARPSGILGGGLIALIGSLGVLFFAHRFGFEVPNSIFAALFIIGFGVGLIGELIVKSLALRRLSGQKKYKGHKL